MKPFLELKGCLPPAVVIDPPWQVAGANVTREVAISYRTIPVEKVLQISLKRIIPRGYLFMWVVPSIRFEVEQELRRLGFKIRGEITWVKYSGNNKLQSSMGVTGSTADPKHGS